MPELVCCARPAFGLIEELGHVEAVDWDLGRCGSCGSYLLRQWSPHAPARVYHDALTGAQGERLLHAARDERLALLKAWYAEH